jgi:hypothetical protein
MKEGVKRRAMEVSQSCRNNAAPTIVQAAQEKPTMQTATPKPSKSGHAAVSGVNYYYAVYGTGEPLLPLHGGLGQIEMFGPNLPRAVD